MKRTILFIGLWLVAVVVLFSACTADDTEASKDWVGNWKMTQEITWPQTKADNNLPSGTITIDANNKDKIIISGGLLNCQTNISASVVSQSATFSQTIDNNYTIKGTATLNSQTKITFKFTIYLGDTFAGSHTLTAIKI